MGLLLSQQPHCTLPARVHMWAHTHCNEPEGPIQPAPSCHSLPTLSFEFAPTVSFRFTFTRRGLVIFLHRVPGACPACVLTLIVLGKRRRKTSTIELTSCRVAAEARAIAAAVVEEEEGKKGNSDACGGDTAITAPPVRPPVPRQSTQWISLRFSSKFVRLRRPLSSSQPPNVQRSRFVNHSL